VVNVRGDRHYAIRLARLRHRERTKCEVTHSEIFRISKLANALREIVDDTFRVFFLTVLLAIRITLDSIS
jgi:hypothetical protein